MQYLKPWAKVAGWVSVPLIALSLIYITAIAIHLHNLRVENLLFKVYNLDEDGFQIYPKAVAEYYMLHFRNYDKDVVQLENGAGLPFILNAALSSGQRDKALRYAALYVKKGHDINKPDSIGLTALHHSIYNNEPAYVDWLMKNGANPNIPAGTLSTHEEDVKTELTGLTPLDLATYLTKEDGKDRSLIIKILLSISAEKKG